MRYLLTALLLAAACGPSTSEPGDAGSDAAIVDAGATPDAGLTDAGDPDGGPGDAGAMDAGGNDAGGLDAGGPDAGGPDAGLGDAGEPDAGTTDGGNPLLIDRPYAVTVPDSYDGTTPVPLVVLLHGFSADAASQDLYLGISALARQRGFLVALPDGTRNPSLLRFWDATDACCAFGQTVDDVAYLTALLDDMEARFNVDPRRIFFVGHSNGGFMSHRMACERAGRVAAIVSLAGAVWKDETLCTPTEPVSILQVHGTFDAVILYGGGWNATIAYPGAVETVATWAEKNGCDTNVSTLSPDLDLVTDLLGDETTRLAHDACPGSGAAELWRMGGATHLPTFNGSFAGSLYDWLLAHPKP